MTHLFLFILLSLFSTAGCDSAEHCLAITEYQDRHFICPSSDSLILYAVDYYDHHGNRAERAKAHYLLGCVEADLFNRAQAIYQLRLAARLNPDKNNNQQALIYSRLSYLLYEHHLYPEAEEIYQQSLQLAEFRHDTIDLTHSLMQLGNLLLLKSQTVDAASYIEKAYQLSLTQSDNYLQATVLTALYSLYKQTGEFEKAEQAARLCYSIVPHPTRTWPAMYNLGETLYNKEQLDSAALLLKPILEIDHSYELRANAADILEKISIKQGNTTQAHTYNELQKALRRSAQMSLQTTAVLRQELEELEIQAYNRQRTSIILWISVSILIVIIISIFIVIIYRYLKKQTLTQQIANMQSARQSLVQEEFASSEVYTKLMHIVELARVNPFTRENLTNNDWQQLSVYADNLFAGIITHLRTSYHLSEDELHICLLFLLNVPVICIGHFVKGYSRNTIQLKARQIPLNAGAAKGTLLRDWLAAEVHKLKS